MQQTFESFGAGMSWDKVQGAFASNSALTPEVRGHLRKVYMTLAGGCAVAAAGSYVYMLTHVHYMLPFLASLLALFVLRSTPSDQESKRLGCFMLVAFAQGVSIGGLVELALFVDPTLILMALGTTAVLFASFTVAALKAERRSQLYLGGLLGSALGYMSLLSLANIFFRSQMLWNVNLYGGLLVFSGYLVFDTQLMIEKAAAGDRDHIKHALELFMDLAAVFVRILIILLKNQENSNKRRRERAAEGSRSRYATR